ncbi:YggT family protein [Candidatus Cyanaurora vandensis]|uniref:YggT family protein n=1 Tax=Candidatus Cyanaurora vandensis TaxID=2714958 RepID=UPI00257F9A41|nr:YggT family protein [Candidatus Cyanaurora vandensis]
MDVIVNSFVNFLQIYSYILIGRILLTWFPNIDWFQQPWATISQLTDPYLDIFRRFIPPLAGIDFSPIVAILLLNVAQAVAQSALGALV